ncbi:phage capsid protein [Pontibacillus chungwhensis BH030062]|uniref:Phage capsid protein n=1 Tax=Pontibacillus chungwhensis BH030062 TaxID=1385513 RepID=A0A0A2UV97_9BACI|nr:DUF6366 family protein [Pontibacillus chungwhensis]KGP91829.1 phage capsid protein [Pontibacillus chungwhensis BH030062]
MNHQKETSKERRKRMRETSGRKYLKEDKNWTTVDYFSLGHVVGRMGWKGTGLLIVFMIVGYIIYKMV